MCNIGHVVVGGSGWCGWGVIELREVSWLVGVAELLFPANEVLFFFFFFFFAMQNP